MGEAPYPRAPFLLPCPLRDPPRPALGPVLRSPPQTAVATRARQRASIGIDGSEASLFACHTSGQAGPHPAVRDAHAGRTKTKAPGDEAHRDLLTSLTPPVRSATAAPLLSAPPSETGIPAIRCGRCGWSGASPLELSARPPVLKGVLSCRRQSRRWSKHGCGSRPAKERSSLLAKG